MTVDRQFLRACCRVTSRPFAYPYPAFIGGGVSADVLAVLRGSSRVVKRAWPDGINAPGRVATDAQADEITTTTMLALRAVAGHTNLVEVSWAILDAEGPLLDWWCEKIVKHMGSAS